MKLQTRGEAIDARKSGFAKYAIIWADTSITSFGTAEVPTIWPHETAVAVIRTVVVRKTGILIETVGAIS